MVASVVCPNNQLIIRQVCCLYYEVVSEDGVGLLPAISNTPHQPYKRSFSQAFPSTVYAIPIHEKTQVYSRTIHNVNGADKLFTYGGM